MRRGLRRRVRQLNGLYRDRVGLAWRDELAPDLHVHLHELDCIEILAEREFNASRRRIDALRELALRIPVSLHGVALGLASSEAVAEKCLASVTELPLAASVVVSARSK